MDIFGGCDAKKFGNHSDQISSEEMKSSIGGQFVIMKDELFVERICCCR